jgi:hypothetical protein
MSSTFEGSDMNSESIGHEENIPYKKLGCLYLKPDR